MYQVVFTPAAADQYAEVENRWSEARKRLATFWEEIDAVIDHLQNMPESYSATETLSRKTLEQPR